MPRAHHHDEGVDDGFARLCCAIVRLLVSAMAHTRAHAQVQAHGGIIIVDLNLVITIMRITIM